MSGRVNPQLAKQWFNQWEDWLGAPRGFLEALAFIESSYNKTNGTFRNVTNSMGAAGLMQITPITVKDIENQYQKRINPLDPLQAIMGAAMAINIKRQYIKRLYGFEPNWRELVAAYNGALSNAQKARQNKALPQETIKYFAKLQQLGIPLV